MTVNLVSHTDYTTGGEQSGTLPCQGKQSARTLTNSKLNS